MSNVSAHLSFARAGLYETEGGRHVERFGNVAQVRSVAVARRTPDGAMDARFVNYFQLCWDGERWWIAGMVRDGETSTRPIPAVWIRRSEDGQRCGDIARSPQPSSSVRRTPRLQKRNHDELRRGATGIRL